MHIEVLENEKEKVMLELSGESATITQVVAKTGWEFGGEIAAVQEHPFTEQPKLVSIGPNALKNLEKAVSKVITDTEEFEAEFKKVVKK